MHNFKCGCQWINSEGKATPDQNDAIAMAICYDPRSFGELGSQPFPICQQHAEKKGKFWKLLPLPGQTEDQWHPRVQEDARWFKVVPNVVRDSIRNSYPEKADCIMKDLQWAGDHFYFILGELYIGVELDGYLHT